MGIQGLLPFLRSIQRESHLQNWRGKTLAIDGYVWLHRGVYHCAQELCLGKPTTKHVDYFMRNIKLLHAFGVTAYVVFDGDHLPSKKLTETDRQNRRRAALANAHRLLAQGDQNKAREEFVKAVDVTPQLAHDVILALRSIGVKYVVAPYEADAQLRYLEMKGEVDAIITEDSDLLVYGSRNVLFKMDHSGHCIHICRDDFGMVEDKRMGLWQEQEFRQMAILSGCDYLSSIPGLGIKKAHDLIRRHRTAERAIKATRLDGKLSVPLKYEQSFREAELTFEHQFVYDPTTRAMVPLTPLPSPSPSPESLAGCGQKWPDQLIVDVAEGRVDPVTKEVFLPKSTEIKHSLPLLTSKTMTPQRPTQKHPALSSGKQTTLNQFAFKQASSNTDAPSLTPVRPAAQPKSDNTPRLTGSSRLEPLNGQPSKFFTSHDNAPSLEPNSESQGFIATNTTIEDLSAEDVAPLTQEDWDRISEMSADDSLDAKLEDPKSETEFDRLISEDLPSSEMHDPLSASSTIPSISRAPLKPCISSSSVSSNFTASNKENRPTAFQDDLLDTSVCASSSQEIANSPFQDLSDDVITSSEVDEADLTITKPRVTIITPSNHHSTSMMLDRRRVSEPISRHTRQSPISSDPIPSSDNENNGKINTLGTSDGLTRRKGVRSITSHSHQPPKRVCRGFIETPSSKLSNVMKRCTTTATAYDEDISPSLARVASGIRNRFTYQKPSSNKQESIGTPKLFDFSKTKHTQNDDNNDNHTSSKRRGPPQMSSDRRPRQLPLESLNNAFLDDTPGPHGRRTASSADPAQADPPVKRQLSERNTSSSKQSPAATTSSAHSSNKLSMFKFRGSRDHTLNPI